MWPRFIFCSLLLSTALPAFARTALIDGVPEPPDLSGESKRVKKPSEALDQLFEIMGHLGTDDAEAKIALAKLDEFLTQHDQALLNLSLFPAPITRNKLPLSQALGTVGAYVQNGYVLFGLEIRTKDGSEPLVDLNLPSASRLLDGLRQIIDQIPGYKYEVISPHMVNIYPASANSDPADVLNTPVPQFDAVDVDPAQILSRPMDFIPQLATRLRPKSSATSQPRGVIGEVMRGVNSPTLTLHLKDTTVRQILNSTSDAMGQFPPDSQPLGWVYLFQPDPKLPGGGKHSWMFLFSAPRNWKQEAPKPN